MLSSLLFTVFVAEGETRGKFGHLVSQTGSRCLFLKPQASWEGRRGRTFWSCMSRLVTILTEPGLFRGERLEGIICNWNGLFPRPDRLLLLQMKERLQNSCVYCKSQSIVCMGCSTVDKTRSLFNL
nr:uncharacterized protein LOC131796121 isoform X1 [Pocillopora verrucosa]